MLAQATSSTRPEIAISKRSPLPASICNVLNSAAARSQHHVLLWEFACLPVDGVGIHSWPAIGEDYWKAWPAGFQRLTPGFTRPST